MTDKKRYIWLDIIKIMACFFVIINHSHNLLFLSGGTTTATVTVDAIMFSVCKTAVPLFVMTTGYLLLQGEFSGRQMLRRILRIGIPLLAISVVYYVLNSDEGGSIPDFVKQFAQSPRSVHLWYLYMLIGLYLVMPFVSKIVRYSTTRELVAFVALFLVGPAVVRSALRYFEITPSAFFFEAIFPVAIGYLIAGCAMSRIELNTRCFWCAVVLFILFVMVSVFSVLTPYLRGEGISYVFDSWQYLPIVVSSLSLFYILRYLFESARFGEKTAEILKAISSTIFGVYLIHCVAISKLYELVPFQTIFRWNPYVGLIVLQICCFAGCAAIVFLIKKIPIVKKLL